MNDDNSTELVRIDLQEGICIIQFTRPGKKNALNSEMYTAIIGALRSADDDDRIRVIVITGTQDCFTSGNDLADFLASPRAGEAPPAMVFLTAISEARKPIVAAVQGTAVGVGVTMLLHCDLVFAGRSALFRMPFVNLGLCPEAGSTLLLPRMMGHQRAAELLLLGEPFTAEKAREVGIVNSVFPDDEVIEMSMAKARQLAKQPPAAVRLAKSLLKREYAASLRETIAYEGKHFRDLLKSPEAMEALKAFMERRKPDTSKY